CLFKPPLLLIGATHSRRAAGTGLGIFALGLLLSFRQLFSWAHLLAETTSSRYCSPSNQGVFGIACQYAGPDRAVWVALFLGLIGAAVAFAAAARSRAHQELRSAGVDAQ